MEKILKSNKLANVSYAIRGPLLEHAKKLEEAGRILIKLNIGDLDYFGIHPPEEVIQDTISNLPFSAGYSDSKGIFSARKAIMHETQRKNIIGVGLDDIYIGNGASELIMFATNALLNNGDEVLVPAPDYPLWTAAVALAGGSPVHYLCDPDNQWQPNISDIAQKINKKTRAIVVINPNNPTGALYSDEVLLQIIELAKKHNLIVMADEVYDKILYDGNTHTSMASLSQEVLMLTFNSLSKSYRACGYRAGWMFVSGCKSIANDYIDGLNTIASMRLCSNLPGQWAIQTALGGYQSINKFTEPGGRLFRQRNLMHKLITEIPGLSCMKPKASLYMFPRLDPQVYPIKDDKEFFLDMLDKTGVLLVQGTGFNWIAPDHFRLVFLPDEDLITDAIAKIAQYLADYRKLHG